VTNTFMPMFFILRFGLLVKQPVQELQVLLTQSAIGWLVIFNKKSHRCVELALGVVAHANTTSQ